jgi:hypothetical protein
MKKRKKKGNKQGTSIFTRIAIVILTIVILLLITSMVFRFSKRRRLFPEDIPVPYTRVEVLNGCGVDNLAYKVALYLREEGFDVVEIGNVTETNVERTIIIERVDKKMKNAKLLGRVIHCTNMQAMIDSTLFLEVSLLLGEDYEKYFPKKVLERKIY